MRTRALDLDRLTPADRDAIRSALTDPKFELIPMKNASEQANHLPDGATVTVTSSPAKGMGATIDLAVELQTRGFKTIPHLSARTIADRRELTSILERMSETGLKQAFVVGGDSAEHGEFFDGLALLTAMEEIGHDIDEVGIPGYPEGHHIVDETTILKALAQKIPFASYVTSQMCFVPEAITQWVDKIRARGIGLGIHVGIPGVADLTKLIPISLRIGVGPSARFLTKNRGLAGRLVRPGGYSPDQLLLGLAPALADRSVNIHGLHIYTFNRVEATEEWRLRMIEELS